jgi:hypothetical protein
MPVTGGALMILTKTVLSLLFGVVIASACSSPVDSDPMLTLGLSPTALSIQQNAQGTSTLTLTRSGDVAGSVALSATGAPSGMTVTLDPTNTNGNSSAITVTAGPGVEANTYPITIQGQATNATSSATLTVTVAASGNNTTYRFCDQAVLFAAFQDGSGPWTVASIVNNASIFNIGSGNGAIVYVVSLNDVPHVTFDYGTQAELNGIECESAPATRMLSGTTANIATNQLAYVAMGGSYAEITAASPSFTLNSVPVSPTDLVAARLAVGTTADVADKIIVRRSLDTSSPLQLLDFDAAEAATPVSSTLTLGNLDGDQAYVSIGFRTQTTTAVPVYYDYGSTSTARPYVGFATPQPTDLHVFSMLAIPAAIGSGPRVLAALFRDASSRTLTLGPVVGGVTITKTATTPYVLLRAQYTTPPEYNQGIVINYSQSAGGSLLRKYDLEVSRGYLGTSTALDITLPDLTGLAGWNPGWSLASGTATQWQLTAGGSNDPETLDGLITVGGSQAGVTP